MASVNKVILVGNLGADPETRYTAGGTAVSNIRIATSDNWNDKQTGERQERTEWHKVVFFNRLAEVVQQYLRKGSQVYIEGSIRTQKWQDQNGQDRYTTEIVANTMQMLGSRQDAMAGSYTPAPPAPAQNYAPAPNAPMSAPPATAPMSAPPPATAPMAAPPPAVAPMAAPAAGNTPPANNDFDDDVPF